MVSLTVSLTHYLTGIHTVLGKAEGQGVEWHGHVTAITVAPEYRRLSLGRKMMNLLELVSDATYRGFAPRFFRTDPCLHDRGDSQSATGTLLRSSIHEERQ